MGEGRSNEPATIAVLSAVGLPGPAMEAKLLRFRILKHPSVHPLATTL